MAGLPGLDKTGSRYLAVDGTVELEADDNEEVRTEAVFVPALSTTDS